MTVRKLRPVSLAKTKVATAYSPAGTPGSNLVGRRSAAYYLPSDLLVCAEGAARVDWISCARSRSTLVFNTVPPRPRIAGNITSISPLVVEDENGGRPWLHQFLYFADEVFADVLSLIGIFAGAIVLFGMFSSKRLNGWTALFLASTVLT